MKTKICFLQKIAGTLYEYFFANLLNPSLKGQCYEIFWHFYIS